MTRFLIGITIGILLIPSIKAFKDTFQFKCGLSLKSFKRYTIEFIDNLADELIIMWRV